LCALTLAKNNDIRAPDVRVHSDPLEFVKALAALSPARPTVPAAASASSSAAAAAAAPPSPSSGLSAPRAEWSKYVASEQAAREKEIDAMAAKEAARAPVVDSTGQGFVNPLRLCRLIDEVLPENTRIVADGGDFVGTASYTVKPRQPLSWLDPGVFGTLGVGGGFALAAKLVAPDETVVILYGDGASGFSLMEFDTYVRMKTPVIAIIGNDACWSQMYRDQIRLLKSAVATELSFTTRYDLVAEGLGAKGILVRDEAQIKPALLQALQWSKEGHSVIINCMIAKSGFREGSISL
jgi:thiamine pyrophosphate-dependent acetolactate synthase large subunit-like protein